MGEVAEVSGGTLPEPAGQRPSLRFVRWAVRVAVQRSFRLRVRGLEWIPRSGPVIVAGNHAGFLDGPLVCVVFPRPAFFLAKSELFSGPWRRVLDWADQIPIQRGTPDRVALHRGLGVLAAGGVLGVFPEGTRGHGQLESIQHGIGYLALKAGCPIVPVVCLGTAGALPKGRWIPKFGSRLDVVFGPPFHVEVEGDPRARSTMAAAAEQVRTALVEHLSWAAAHAAGVRADVA